MIKLNVPRTPRIAFWCLLGILILPSQAVSQSRYIDFEHLSVGDGLSNGEVKCVAEDRLGYLWIGTADGLNRYDGYSFKVFRHSRSDTTTLGDSYITSLYVDRSGTLWVGTRSGGLCRYNPDRMNFDRFTSRPDVASSLGKGAVNGIYEDRSGTFWVTTSEGGINRFDREHGRFTRYNADPSNPRAPRANNLGAMYDDGRGTLWIGSWAAGLHALDLGDGTFEQYGKVPPADTLGIRGVAGVLSIYPAQSGKFWVGTRRQLNLFDPSTKSFELMLPDNEHPGRISRAVNAVLVDRFKTLWIGTFFDGLILVDLNRGIGEKFVHYRYGHDRREEGWIPSSSIDAIFEDSRGNVWVATGDGLLKASRNRNRFRHLRHLPSDPASLPDDRIRSILADGGDSVWLATGGGGLVLYDARTGGFVGFTHDPGNPASIGGDLVNQVVRGDSGSFWLALEGKGINHFSPKTGRFVRYESARGAHIALPTNWINTVARTPDGRIWLGSNEGLISFDPTRNAFDPIEALSDYSITAIHPASDGSLWLGTYEDGLFRYRPSSDEIEQFSHTPGTAGAISNNRIRAIFEGSDKDLWIGTHGGGVNLFKPLAREFRIFDETKGLAGDVVAGVAEDARGTIWVSTNKGLSRFDSTTGLFRSYDATDGLPATRFIGNGMRLKSGELAFGAFSDGIVLFHPDELIDNPVVPSVLVTGVRKYGSEENLLNVDLTAFTFSHFENNFTVDFVALDCTAPKKNRYAYRLEGLTPGWVQCGTRRSVEFTNVASGEYTLRVRGSNNDGVWGETPSPVRFTVLPPFWETWWFYGASLLALTGALTALHRYRVSRLLEIERLRMRIAGDLHDDLGSDLSGIALMSDLARKKAETHDERERLAFISRTARQMAESIKDLSWVVNPLNDTFDNLALRMKDTAVVMLAGIEHTFTVSDRRGTVALPIEARRNVFLVYKEALHNIVKHSGATRVEITLEEAGDTLKLTVYDNGRGIGGSGVSTGSGLRNIHSRAKDLGGRVDIANGPEGGTRVTLSVKIP